MADKELDKVNDGAPAMDIPDLKKKEKERKKAGAAWGSAKPTGNPFGAATGGSGAAARAAASAASSAAGTAAGVGSPAAFSGLSGWLAGVLATTMGKMIVGLGALLMVGGAGLVGLAMLRGGGEGNIIPDLGGLSSSLKIDRGGADRTAITGKGDIRFDPLAAQAAKKEEAKVEDKTAEAPAATDTLEHGTINDTQGGSKDKLAHNLSGAKLTSNLGGGSFGSKNIFGGAGSANAPKFNTGLAKANLSIPKANNGKLGAMKKSGRSARASKMTKNNARTQRAFGQLKVARGLSVAGAGATTADAASANAANAFDQSASNGGELEAPGAGAFDGAPSNPGGGGAPDMTSVPDVGTPNAVLGDPTMDQGFKNIEKMAAAAGKMKMMGMLLIAIGVVLIAMAGVPVVGPILAVIGAILVGLGIMLMQQAAQMAAMAKQLGSMMANQYGTGTYQEQAVNECTDQVLDNGGGGCNRPGPTPAATTVQQDVEAERTTPVLMEGNGGPVQ